MPRAARGRRDWQGPAEGLSEAHARPTCRLAQALPRQALTYRVVIVCLDFLAIYIFTHKVEVALGFMVVSNVYTTVGYFVHERIWAHIAWGMTTTAIASKT